MAGRPPRDRAGTPRSRTGPCWPPELRTGPAFARGDAAMDVSSVLAYVDPPYSVVSASLKPPSLHAARQVAGWISRLHHVARQMLRC